MGDERPEQPAPADGAERRKGERRTGADRRKQDLGPPSGVERRREERRQAERRSG